MDLVFANALPQRETGVVWGGSVRGLVGLGWVIIMMSQPTYGVAWRAIAWT